MPPISTRRTRQSWLGRGLRVWVVLLLLAGSLLSALGHLNSHGLAAMAVAQHGHAHDDGDGAAAGLDATQAQHNNADHSHEKAHALPGRWAVPMPAGAVRRPLAHPLGPDWIAAGPERPPRG